MLLEGALVFTLLALIRCRKAFPVLFGSGLREAGVRDLLELLAELAPERSAAEEEPFPAAYAAAAEPLRAEETCPAASRDPAPCRSAISFSPTCADFST